VDTKLSKQSFSSLAQVVNIVFSNRVLEDRPLSFKTQVV